MSKKSRFLLLFTLFLGLSFGVFFSSAANTNAYPELSPDGKTCTPCHEEGFNGGGAETPAENPAETPVENPVENPTGTPAEQPTEQPAAQPSEQAEAPEEANEPMSPWIVVGGVIVILAIIYFLAIRKK